MSAVFVPVVALLALLTWLAWYLAGTASWYPASWLPQASSSSSSSSSSSKLPQRCRATLPLACCARPSSRLLTLTPPLLAPTY